MLVVAYKAKFHALFSYATQLLGTREKRIQLFVKIFNTDLQVLSIHITSKKCFTNMVDFVKNLEGVKNVR